MNLVLDIGTTRIKLAVFDKLNLVDLLSVEISTNSSKDDRAEQDPIEIYNKSFGLLTAAISKYKSVEKLGISTQRESFVLWNKITAKPYYPVILWQDKRTKQVCEKLQKNKEISQLIRKTTGLKIDTYFSATKLQWLLQHLNLESEELAKVAFGTIDSWILYKLCNVHLCDQTNASRTMLYDIEKLSWQPELLKIFGIPGEILPKVLPSKSNFGEVKELGIKIQAVAGDQQASLFAAGDSPGTVKVTYGTGIFPMKLIGPKISYEDSFLTTLAINNHNQTQYALETKIEDGSNRTTPVLNDPEKLKQVVEELAVETQPILTKLIDSSTKQIFVDGGISQNDNLINKQAELNNISITRLSTYEGSALGIAKLLI